MTQAILIGESFQLQKVWTENFRSTGTFHALVISGTHVAALAGFLLLLLRLLFVPRGTAALAAVAASWLYALITGWQAPCVRSAAGFTIFLVGGYFYRERRLMNILAAVALAFLVLDPEQMFEPSFQLSFLAVGFIGAFAVPLLERTTAPLARGLRDLGDVDRDPHLQPRAAQFRVEMRLLAETLRLWTRVPRRWCERLVAWPARAAFHVFELVLLSAVVQTGLALPMVIYFHRVGFTGLSANALVIPAMGLMVPVGFVALLTGWGPAAQLSTWLLHFSQAVVDWHAAWEPNWRVPSPPFSLALALVAALVAAALSWNASRPLRVLASAAVLGLVALLLWHPFPPRVERHALELTAVDVGQGDSLLVALPDGRLMLVDGGGIPTYGGRARPRLDIGEDVVAPYLWQRSVTTVDVIVCSHAHEDHIGGLPALLRDFHVRELWTGATPDTPQWRALRAEAAGLGVRVVPLRRGARFGYGGAEVEVLAPAPDYEPGRTARNNDSLALRVGYGSHGFLLSGDIERQVEADIAAAGPLARTDVLKVPHHGSRTSSTDVFLDAVHPAIAVLSAGVDNPYGHPNQEVLERYAGRGVELLRTDRDGLITVRTDGRRLTVDTARWNGQPALLNRVF